jgi:WD40 repeat protein
MLVLRRASAAVAVGLVVLMCTPVPAARNAVNTAAIEVPRLQVTQRLRLSEGVRDLRISEHGTLAVLGQNGHLFVVGARGEPRELAPLNDATSVSISRDGKSIACGHSQGGGRLSIWKAPRWDQPLTISTGEFPPVTIEVSRSAAVVTAHIGSGVRSWDAVTGEPKGPSAGWSAVFAWSPRDDVLATVDGDTEIELLSRREHWQRKVVRPVFPDVARERLAGDGILDVQQYQHRLAWSPDGRHLAVESSFTKSIRVYDVASGKVTYESPPVDTHRTEALEWSGDGRSLLCADRSEVMRYSLTGGTRQVAELPSPARISATALSPGGRHVALGYADGAVVVGALEGGGR